MNCFQQETTVGDGALTFVSMKPLDIFLTRDQSSRQYETTASGDLVVFNMVLDVRSHTHQHRHAHTHPFSLFPVTYC